MMRSALCASIAACALVFVPSPAPAASLGYNATLAGVSETFDGQKFKFTGTGAMTFDDVAGTVDYSFQLSNGLTFAGSGSAAVTPKGRIFGVVNTTSGGIAGSAVVDGKASKDRRKFAVAITAAIPNRLGPAPQGFVLSKMKAKGTKLQ